MAIVAWPICRLNLWRVIDFSSKGEQPVANIARIDYSARHVRERHFGSCQRRYLPPSAFATCLAIA